MLLLESYQSHRACRGGNTVLLFRWHGLKGGGRRTVEARVVHPHGTFGLLLVRYRDVLLTVGACGQHRALRRASLLSSVARDGIIQGRTVASKHMREQFR
jgi:hypothetical protein